MKTANMNAESKVNEASFLNEKLVKISFRSKRAEIIAWAIFFGVGVSYFVATLILAL